jgi:serine/threonine-protein kinase
MNDPNLAPQGEYTTTHTYKIPVHWQKLARAVWLLLITLSLLVYAVAFGQVLTNFGQHLPNFWQVDALPLEQTKLVVGYFLLLDALSAVPFFVVAFWLYRSKPDSRMVMVTSIMLATFGGVSIHTVTNVLMANGPIWQATLLFLGILGNSTFLFFLYSFPDGRFANRYAKLLCTFSIIWFLIFNLAPERLQSIIPPTLSVLISTAAYGFSLFVQQQWHINQMNETQKQQVKWITTGLTAALAGYVFAFLPETLFPVLSQPGPTQAIYRMFSQFVVLATLSLLPLTIGMSLVRYRLWDIDFFINRGLVYGALSLLMVGLTLLNLWVLRQVYTAVTGQQSATIPLVLAALLAGVTFQPIHRRLQKWVDRRLYHININYRPNKTDARPIMEAEGQTIGSYRVHELIGRGGMANVYKGEHPTLHQTVAIKIMLADQAQEADFRTRFEREAQATSSLRHSNIVKLYDFGQFDGAYYMVMEYIDGPNLRDFLQLHAPLPVETAVALIEDIAEALDYAHEQGLVHRDIKPSNVMVQTGSITGQQAILTDFGIVKIMGGNTGLTRTGLVGTVDYMAPEQIKDAKDVDGRADLYSLGVMAYELLTGQRPFPASNPGAVLIAHLQQPPPDPTHLRPDLPPQIAAVILRLLAKEPDHRYATARLFLNDLRQAETLTLMRNS